MLNSVLKISMMSAKYFEYYTIILRGPFFRFFFFLLSFFFPRLISAVAEWMSAILQDMVWP